MKNRLKEIRQEKKLTLKEVSSQLEQIKLRIAEMQLNAVATAYKKTIHFDFGNLKKEYGGLDEHNR